VAEAAKGKRHQDILANRVSGASDGCNLSHHIKDVASLLDHLSDASDLALDSVQTGDDGRPLGIGETQDGMPQNIVLPRKTLT
jgi:hypothetical protein